MHPLTERLAAMGPDALEGGLIALDSISRPMQVREIEHALRRHGVPKSRAVKIASSIKGLNIIAVLGPEHG